MRVTAKSIYVFLLAMVAASTCPGIALAQHAANTDQVARPELALAFTNLHANAPPGGCGCFYLNGGSATFAWPLRAGHFALVGDITAADTNAAGSNPSVLTLSTYTAGARYTPRLRSRLFKPYGQLLAGLAHASGSLVQGQSAATSNAGAAFAANLGGGLDLRVSRRFSLRIIEADYLITTFDNASNNHQNILRLGVGGVWHF